MTLRRILILTVFTFYSSSVFSLVDYSDNEKVPGTGTNAYDISAEKETPPARPRGMRILQFNTYYESVSTRSVESGGAIEKIGFNGHIETPFNIYGSVSYWQATTQTEEISSKSGYQAGNPKAILGFHWLEMGQTLERASVDLYGGMSLQQKGSAFGSSRNDQIGGIQTSKRFNDFIIGFGGEYRITGTPTAKSEMRIGNITKLSAALGYVISGDLRLSLEAATYTVKAGDSSKGKYALAEDGTFSHISPKLYLGFSRLFELEIGAHFQTDQMSNSEGQDLIDAKLLDLTGSYGNSLFAGLNISV